MAYDATGGPEELTFTDELVGMTKWFDGSLLDLIWKVKDVNK
jgi:citrate lyase alpha subunit